MTKLMNCIVGLVLALPAGGALAAARDGVPGVFSDIGPGQPGCAVATVLKGRVDFSGAFGLANISTGKALTPDTLFESASLSKQMTAFAIFLLEKEGKLSQSDPVLKYIPELGPSGQGVTVGDLVHHTSGLRDATSILYIQDNFQSLSAKEQNSDATMLAAMGRQKAGETPPHVAQLYNNTGYHLLAIVAERAGKTSLKSLLGESVFKPLGMTSTYVGTADLPDADALAASYRVTPNGFQPIPLLVPVPGAMAVRTTANDFALWMENFWTGRVGGEEVMRKMREVVPLPNGAHTDYAGGLSVADYRGLQRLEHGGSADGYRHKMVLYPEQQFAAVVLCNRDDAATTPRVDGLSDVYLADAFKTPKSITSDILKLRTVKDRNLKTAPPGFYRDVIGAEYLRIKSNGDGTSSIEYRGDTRKLTQVDPGIYMAEPLTAFPGFPLYVAFSRGGLNMSYGDDFDRFESVQEWAPADLSRWAGAYWSDEAQAHMTLTFHDGALYAKLGPRNVVLKPGKKGEFLFGRGALEVPAEGPADWLHLRVYGLRGVIFERERKPAGQAPS